MLLDVIAMANTRMGSPLKMLSWSQLLQFCGIENDLGINSVQRYIALVCVRAVSMTVYKFSDTVILRTCKLACVISTL